MINTNKIITIFKTIYKIWEYKITEDEINVIAAKEFTKLNKNGDKYLDVKDIVLAIYDYYKSKK